MIWFAFAFLAAVITGLSAVVEKKTLLKEHAMEFSAVLAIVNFVLTIPFLTTADFNFDSYIWYLLVFNSLLGSIAFLFFAKALRHSEVSITSALLNFRPALVFLLAFIFLKERLSVSQIAGIFLLIAGAYVLEIKHRKQGLLEPFKIIVRSRYAHYVFISIGLYSITTIIDKIILNHITPATTMFLSHLFVMVFFISFMFIFHDGIVGIRHGMRSAGKWIIVVAIFTVTYRYFQTVAVSMASATQVSNIKQTSALFATIIGGTFFHERNLWHKLLAAAIMLIGAILVIS